VPLGADKNHQEAGRPSSRRGKASVKKRVIHRQEEDYKINLEKIFYFQKKCVPLPPRNEKLIN
jgi:hypothetical protein